MKRKRWGIALEVILNKEETKIHADFYQKFFKKLIKVKDRPSPIFELETISL